MEDVKNLEELRGNFPEYRYEDVSELLFRVASELFKTELLVVDIMDDSLTPKQIGDRLTDIMQRTAKYLGIKVKYKREGFKDFIYKVLGFQKAHKDLDWFMKEKRYEWFKERKDGYNRAVHQNG